MPSLPVLALLLASIGSSGYGAELIDRVLATVGLRVITLSDVRGAARLKLVNVPDAGDSTAAVVERLIDRTLMLEEVERYAPPEPPPAAIDAGVAAIRARFANPADLQAVVTATGIDERAVREWVRNDLRIDQYITQRFAGLMEPTPDELQGYIAQHAGDVDPGGRGSEDPAVQRAARERIIAARRETLVREWVDGLRRRAEIIVNPPVSAP
jgi:hypothetical protein